MRRSAAPLLLALLLGALAGPHPCAAAREAAVDEAALPSCHAAAASTPDTGSLQSAAGRAASGEHDGEAPDKALCEKACHAPALAQLAPAPSAMLMAERLAPPPPTAVPAPLSRSLDHVPIA